MFNDLLTTKDAFCVGMRMNSLDVATHVKKHSRKRVLLHLLLHKFVKDVAYRLIAEINDFLHVLVGYEILGVNDDTQDEKEIDFVVVHIGHSLILSE